jgi:hypothetical protein
MNPKLLAGLTTASHATSRIEPWWTLTPGTSPQKRLQASWRGVSIDVRRTFMKNELVQKFRRRRSAITPSAAASNQALRSR